MPNYLIIGPPGSGKSTQARQLAKKLALPHFSSGDVFRRLAKQDTALGRKVRQAMTGGNTLVDNDTALQVMREFLQQQDLQRGFILDGFPRNLYQARKFPLRLEKVIHLNLPDEVAKRRLLKRARLQGRLDDREVTIDKRFQVYHRLTKPLLKHYAQQGRLITVNANAPVEQIQAEIVQKLGCC